MDRLIYTAMTGASATMGQEAAVSHNLANATSTGFKAELHRLRAVPVQNALMPTRAFVVDASVQDDLSTGPLQHTNRPFDVAVRGNFLLDSQFQIQGLPSLVYAHGQAPAGGHQHGGPASATKSPAPTGHEGHEAPKPPEHKH